jgi:hypothetical protein
MIEFRKKLNQNIEPQPIATSVPEVPKLCHFSEEHLQLIFDMRRDVVD